MYPTFPGSFLRCCLSVTILLSPILLAGMATAQTPLADVSQGCALYEQAAFEEAVALLESVLAREDVPPTELQQGRICLARSYVKLGERTRAKLLFMKVLEANPQWRPDSVILPPEEYMVFDQALRESATPAPTPTRPTPGMASEKPWDPKWPEHLFRAAWGYTTSRFKGDSDLLGAALELWYDDNYPSTGSWLATEKRLSGIVLGAGYIYQATPILGINAEFAFARRGNLYKLSDGSLFFGSATEKYEFSYLDLGLLLRVSPPLEGKIRPVLLAGPRLGIVTTAELKSEEPLSTSTEDITDYFSGSLISGVVGAGFDVRLSETIVFSVEGRYAIGLNNIWDDTSSDVEVKISDFSVAGSVAVGM